MVFCQIPNASPALSQAPADAAHMDTTPNHDRLVCAATLRVRARTYIVVSRPKLTRPLLHFLLNPCLVHHPSTSVDIQALGLQQELESLNAQRGLLTAFRHTDDDRDWDSVEIQCNYTCTVA